MKAWLLALRLTFLKIKLFNFKTVFYSQKSHKENVESSHMPFSLLLLLLASDITVVYLSQLRNQC